MIVDSPPPICLAATVLCNSSRILAPCHLYSLFHSTSSLPFCSWFVIGIDRGEVCNECRVEEKVAT